MKLTRYIAFFSTVIAFSACENHETEMLGEFHALTLETSISSFEEEGATRVNIAGDKFESGTNTDKFQDKIRLKIICPFAQNWQPGEHTWTGTKDSFWLLKWNGSSWSTLAETDGYDISGSYSNNGSSNVFGVYESQATPYVYTASTWTEEKLIKVVNASNQDEVVDYYTSVFHADQSRIKNYKASDVLWAQQYSQTGTWNIHLSFNHVMAALLIEIDDSALPDGKKINFSDAVLTLEGMPAIDQAEIIVGDYYAARDENNYTYGYKAKNVCEYANNGKVLGVVYEKADLYKLSGGIPDTKHSSAQTIENSATYTCYHDCVSETGETQQQNQYRLIVPPCVLTNKATLWLRDDTRRYHMTLDRTTFEQGKLYRIKMTVGGASNNE